jgi:hypothetical protein
MRIAALDQHSGLHRRDRLLCDLRRHRRETVKECWRNIYNSADGYCIAGERHPTRHQAVSRAMPRAGTLRLAYRIHVKLKQAQP